MSWLTIVVLAWIVICAVMGFKKGMVRMILSMVFFFVVLGAASWMNPYISDYVREKTNWQEKIEEKCETVILQQLAEREEIQNLTEQITYIEELPLPQTMKEKLIENNNTEIYQRLLAENFSEYLSKYLSYTIINGICFLISVVIATIIMYMILYAVDILTALPVIGTLNHMGGLVIGCIQGILWVWIFFLVVSIMGNTSAGIYLQGEIGSDAILTWVYDHNLLLQIVLRIFG